MPSPAAAQPQAPAEEPASTPTRPRPTSATVAAMALGGLHALGQPQSPLHEVSLGGGGSEIEEGSPMASPASVSQPSGLRRQQQQQQQQGEEVESEQEEEEEAEEGAGQVQGGGGGWGGWGASWGLGALGGKLKAVAAGAHVLVSA